jgi:solute carrier family 25 phosphate transporter 3
MVVAPVAISPSQKRIAPCHSFIPLFSISTDSPSRANTMKIRQSLISALLLPSLGGVDASSATREALSALKALDYRYFVAGGTCAAISHGLTTPIDVVKTKIQADPKKYNQGMRQAAVDIVKTQGPGALLGGLGPTVVGYGVEGAMKVRRYKAV